MMFSARHVEWETIDSVNYYAQFVYKKNNYIVKIDVLGEWKETITDMDTEKFPDVVRNKLNSDYKKYDVFDSQEIKTKTLTIYQIHLDSGVSEIFIQMLSNGILLV
jgi:hypothetical protein